MAGMSTSSNSSANQLQGDGGPTCHCGLRPYLKTSWTDANPGRRFYSCPNYQRNGCNYFVWEDPPMCSRSMMILPGMRRTKVQMEKEIADLKRAKKLMEFLLFVSWCIFLSFWSS
ncbi:hypothetical protein BUALT_Bualt17G0094900 [Buddleja alternifolia]|uniref:GRF-type domain-containing protein n=1 Tax=Buddleja alternifolia TaxID=168488 RepID=A0AAV6WDX6_9LAMI|nr:hypothetical protein BUALT_Bualt17G0094900 [Buddleja alternifolia]